MVRSAPAEPADRWVISCDYGTVNPTSMGLWGKWGGVWYRVQEYYYDARAARRQQTDQEYAQRLRELAGGREIEAVVVDPSAASFLEVLRREGWHVRKADNEVLSGIRQTADALKQGKIVICPPCTDAIREFASYCWDLSAGDRGPGCGRNLTTPWMRSGISWPQWWRRRRERTSFLPDMWSGTFESR